MYSARCYPPNENNMTVIELLELVFYEIEEEFSIFRAGSDQSLTFSLKQLEYVPEDADSVEMLLTSSEVVGVEVSDPSIANFSATNGEETRHYAIFDAPVPLDDVPEAYDLEIPLGSGWTYQLIDKTLRAPDDVLGMSGNVTQNDTEQDNAETDLEDEAGEGEPELEADGGGTGEDDPVDLDQGLPDVSGGEPEHEEPGDEAVAAAPDGIEGAGDAVEPAVAPKFFNDAEILGKETPAFDEALGKEVTFLTGELWGQRDRRNTLDEKWQPVTMPLVRWIDGAAGTANTPAFGLSRHPEVKHKEGTSFVLGSSIAGARKAKAMDTMFAMGLDIDSGAKLDDMLDKVEAMGLFCIVYTSHSHGKSGLQLKHEEVIKKLKIKPSELNLAQVQRYLREHSKERYEEDFILKVEIIEEKKQVKSGVVIDLKTPPLDKFRLIFPLAEPVKLIELADTQSAALDVWENKITGLATEMLGVHFDTSCTDPSRLFFLPRHPKGAKEWYSAIIQGDPLRFEDVPEVKKSAYASLRRPLNPFEMAGGVQDNGDLPPRCVTPSGASLNDWHSKAKDRFQMADLVEDQCADRIRVSGGEAQGHVHIECPFEHEHSEEGGTATMVINALDNHENGYWTWFCHHDSCQSRHKLEFVQEALAQQWFSEDELFGDTVYMMEGADEDEEEATEEEAEADIEVTAKTFPEQAALFTDEATEEDIFTFIKKAHRLGADKVERGKISKALQKATGLGLTDLKQMWKDLDAEQRKKEREKAKKTGKVEKEDMTALVNEWSFHDMNQYAHRCIHDRNQELPSVFHYMEGLCVIRENSEGHARMKFLDRDGFAHHLNTVASFGKVSGEDGTVRGVSAPEDVVRHLFAADKSIYPELRGLVSTPIFTADGHLLTTPGYDWESHLYYQPDMSLSVPNVSKEPTADEIQTAKQLLIEEIFADFPLGGLTRPEIVEGALHGEGLPAVTNLMAMVLLPFMRELVDGPTPGHLLTKPAPGTGASLLTDVFSIIASGRETPALAMPSSKDEMSKTLTSILSNGQNIVFFDNINHSVDSGELASAMTAPTYQARILGRTQTVEVAVRCTWVFTGNNVQLSSELLRRLIMVDLDAQVANPELRTGFRHKDIRGWAREHRGDLVWACLTLIQNWVAQGMEMQKDVVLASYENWSGAVGGVLKAAGMKGFMQNRDKLKEKASDDEGDAMSFLLEAWWDEFGAKPAYIKAPAGAGSSGGGIGLAELAMQEELPLPVRKERGPDGDMTFSVTGFGKWLGAFKGRVYVLEDGTEVRIERDGKRTAKGYQWNLVIQNRDVKSNVEV